MSGQQEHRIQGRISAEVPDWSLEAPRRFWDPGRKLLRSIRHYQHWRNKRGLAAACRCKLSVLNHRFWSIVTGADIPLNCTLGGGLLIPHPNGIVIHPEAKIGVNCLIFQQVAIGSRGANGVPVIAGHVEIGAGAKVLGSVRIGAHAKIGANAVVLKDVPSEAVAIGVPARIIESKLLSAIPAPAAAEIEVRGSADAMSIRAEKASTSEVPP